MVAQEKGSLSAAEVLRSAVVLGASYTRPAGLMAAGLKGSPQDLHKVTVVDTSV